ncbi:MAG: SEC-C metal-binding domain-containing protein [Phycisphaerae bacterium]
MARGENQFDQHFERKREQKENYVKGLPGEDDAPLPPPVDTIKNPQTGPGRNDPCPCGSGKKYKKCCGRKD